MTFMINGQSLIIKIEFVLWCFARLSKDRSSHLLYRRIEMNGL